jgi:hypothetical protein
MYKVPKYHKSTLKSVVKREGETIEMKVERIVNNKEPIKDGAPQIFTERKEGVIAAYNIRTDRFEIAAEAMDKVSGSIAAKREAKAKNAEAKVVEMKPKGEISGGESTQATN